MAHRQQIKGDVELIHEGYGVFHLLTPSQRGLIREWIQEVEDRLNNEEHSYDFRFCMNPKCVALREESNEQKGSS